MAALPPLAAVIVLEPALPARVAPVPATEACGAPLGIAALMPLAAARAPAALLVELIAVLAELPA